MDAPHREPLAGLTPLERFAWRAADGVARHLKWAATLWQRTFVSGVAWLAEGRRVVVDGLEHLEGLGPESRVLLVADHRSFFDFFVIGAVAVWRSRLPRRVFFPVRSTFFYDHPLGIVVNALMSGMSMFPPILRDRSRQAFNLFALERVSAELARPGTLVGMHPEGTRNKGPDPYSFLRAKPGVGKIVLETPGITVIPVFVVGLSNAVHQEIAWNLFRPRAHRVHVRFGAPVDVTDLAAGESRPATWRRASRRCLEAIAALGAEVRAEREAAGIEAPRSPTPSPGAPGAPPSAAPPRDPGSADRTDSAPPAEGS